VREIALYQRLPAHPNVVQMLAADVSDPAAVWIVLELGRGTLYDAMRRPSEFPDLWARLSEDILHDILSGVAHLHRHDFLHRDLKPDNVLVMPDGTLKLCDFGVARFDGAGTEWAVTPELCAMQYRPPERALGFAGSDGGIDTWAVGCIWACLLRGGRDLFPARATELQHLEVVFRLLGVPTAESWPGLAELRHGHLVLDWKARRGGEAAPTFEATFGSCPPEGRDLLRRLLCCDPAQRLTAAEALRHPYLSPRCPPTALAAGLPPAAVAEVVGFLGSTVRQWCLMRCLNRGWAANLADPANPWTRATTVLALDRSPANALAALAADQPFRLTAVECRRRFELGPAPSPVQQREFSRALRRLLARQPDLARLQLKTLPPDPKEVERLFAVLAARCPALRDLEVGWGGLALGDAALESWGGRNGPSALERVSLTFCPHATDRGLRALVQAAPRLRALAVRWPSPEGTSDALLRHLAASAPELRSFTLHKVPKITPAALRGLGETHPSLCRGEVVDCALVPGGLRWNV
jgi:hypothetical protein